MIVFQPTYMFKTFLISIALVVATVVASSAVHAEEHVCFTQYGGSVVCGSNPPQIHTPVKTGLKDLNFTVIGISFLSVATILFFKNSKFAR